MNIIVKMLFGSHLYGLDTPDSDKDYKSIYKPTLKEVVLGDYPKSISTSTGNELSKNGSNDVDEEVVALQYFINQASRGETYTLDMLHCTNPIQSTYVWDYLVDNRTKFYTKSMKAYIGYVRKQAAKYGLKGSRLADIRKAIDVLENYAYADFTLDSIKQHLYFGEYAQLSYHDTKNSGQQLFYEVNSKKYQTTNQVGYVCEQLTKMYDSYGNRAKQAETNDGVDFKALSHALRAGYQARDIYKHGDFKYPLDETDFILAVKKGELGYKSEIAPVLEELVDEVNILAENSKLPSKVNKSFWDKFILDVYNVS